MEITLVTALTWKRYKTHDTIKPFVIGNLITFRVRSDDPWVDGDSSKSVTCRDLNSIQHHSTSRIKSYKRQPLLLLFFVIPIIFDSCSSLSQICVSQIWSERFNAGLRQACLIYWSPVKRTGAASWSLIYSVWTACLQLAYSCLPCSLESAEETPNSMLLNCSLIYTLTSQRVVLTDLQHKCWTRGKGADGVDVTLCFSWSCFKSYTSMFGEKAKLTIPFFFYPRLSGHKLVGMRDNLGTSAVSVKKTFQWNICISLTLAFLLIRWWCNYA